MTEAVKKKVTLKVKATKPKPVTLSDAAKALYGKKEDTTKTETK